MYGWRIAVAVTVLSDPGWVAAADRLPPPPREWHEPGVYVKHLLQDGILILGTRSAPDRALREAAQLLWNTRPFEKYHAVLRRHRLRMIAVGPFEVPPERPPDWTAAHWAEWWRSHPFGGRQVNDAVRPRCYFSDRNIPVVIHELAHAVQVESFDRDMRYRVEDAYGRAMKRGLWKGSYSATHVGEYWAMAVEIWFGAGPGKIPGTRHAARDNTREDLQRYDPDLARLVGEVFPATRWRLRGPSRD